MSANGYKLQKIIMIRYSRVSRSILGQWQGSWWKTDTSYHTL